MSMLRNVIHSSPAVHAQALLAQFSAGSQGAARSAWIEINRPLTALGLNNPLVGAPVTTAAGSPQDLTGAGVPAGFVITTQTISLPIGMDIKSVTCVAGDIDAGWGLVNFTFGTLNLVNPQGTIGGVNLSMFDPRLQHVDRLAPWILSKTKVDVQVQASLQNGTFYANFPAAPTGHANVFHGFSLNAFQEEQVCAIQTRIEPTDRNVGVADLISIQRSTLGGGLNLHMPAFNQPPSQVGRSPVASYQAQPLQMQQVPHQAMQFQPHLNVPR